MYVAAECWMPCLDFMVMEGKGWRRYKEKVRNIILGRRNTLKKLTKETQPVSYNFPLLLFCSLMLLFHASNNVYQHQNTSYFSLSLMCYDPCRFRLTWWRNTKVNLVGEETQGVECCCRNFVYTICLSSSLLWSNMFLEKFIVMTKCFFSHTSYLLYKVRYSRKGVWLIQLSNLYGGLYIVRVRRIVLEISWLKYLILYKWVQTSSYKSVLWG